MSANAQTETELDTAEAATTAAPDHIAEEMSKIYDRHTSNDELFSRAPNEAESLHSAENFGRVNAEHADMEKEPTDTAPDLPQSWGKKADLWAKLSPEAQELIAKRESEAHRQITEFGTKAKAAEKFSAVLEKYKPIITSAPEEEIENLLYTKAEFRRDPAGFIQRLAQEYGVDLAALGRPEVDPITHIRQQERAAVQSEFQQMLTQQNAQQENARLQYLTAELESFTKDKPWWPKIEAEVAHQIFAMKSANEQRVLANPLAAVREAEERALKIVGIDPKASETAMERKRKADAAKRMASINVSSRGFGGSPKPQGQTLEQSMRDVYDRLNGSSS